jgi:hypothetical protein
VYYVFYIFNLNNPNIKASGDLDFEVRDGFGIAKYRSPTENTQAVAPTRTKDAYKNNLSNSRTNLALCRVHRV